jgi:hypothetical protein
MHDNVLLLTAYSSFAFINAQANTYSALLMVHACTAYPMPCLQSMGNKKTHRVATVGFGL